MSRPLEKTLAFSAESNTEAELKSDAGSKQDSEIVSAKSDDAIIIVGTGPVGMQMASELISRGVRKPVIVYGNEPVQPYNRVRLSDYLSGEMYRDALEIDESVSDYDNIEYRYNCEVTSIDREAKAIGDASGRKHYYSELILATGSKPFIPSIKNNDITGVFTFRTLNEADELLSRKIRTRHTVVLGGGLLGLETARAMQKHHTRITIIEHSKWLMQQQLDEQGAGYLEDYIRGSGIQVIVDDSVVAVGGVERVESVTLRSGISIACDTMIIAAGIRPNIAMARDAGVACGRGVKINDRLQTSEEHIYAIGECAEHKNKVYGLVKPGFDQAAVLAENLSGGDAAYRGSTSATQLKVMSRAVFSAGRNGVDEESGTSIKEVFYSDPEKNIYRKIRLIGNRIIGAMSVGTWHETALVSEAIEGKRHIWFWQLMRYKSTGVIWGSEEDIDVSSWPATATVCNCVGVNRGRLSHVIDNGCMSVECLSSETRAGSVCGSCKPLLAELIGEEEDTEPVRSWRGLLALSALALSLSAMFILIWRIPYVDSVQYSLQWDVLWRDTFYKQVSGYSILALFVIGLIVSLRKRVKSFSMGDYSLWRMAHVILGVGALVALTLHTGFRLGDELNLLLMLNFLLLAIAGANSSTVVATEHNMVPATAKKQRKRWNSLHLLLFWPLPVLLGFHILKFYYF